VYGDCAVHARRTGNDAIKLYSENDILMTPALHHPQNGRQRGFSLIELMMIVVIIGLMAAIAMPSYLQYIAKTQVASGLAEISSSVKQYEYELNAKGGSDGAFTADGLGLTAAANGHRCTITVYSPNADGTATPGIECTLKGDPSIAGAKVQMNRQATGNWVCVIDATNAPAWREAYLPQNCSTL